MEGRRALNDAAAALVLLLNCLLGYAKGKGGSRVHGFSRAQNGAREVGMVGRIGEVLRFQAESRAPAVLDAMPAGEVTVEEVGAIELHARLGGLHLQRAAALGVSDDRRQMQLARLAVEHPVVVVTAGQLELLVVVVDPRANDLGFAEVERRAGYWSQFAGRNQRRVNGSKPVGGDFDLLVENVALLVAVEIEVGVVGQVDHGRLVGDGRVVEAQRFALEGVAHGGRQLAGIAHVAVGADESELDAAGDFLRLPNVVVEAPGAAVQRVSAVVARNLVLIAVNRELAGGDAVAVAAHDRADIGLGPFK